MLGTKFSVILTVLQFSIKFLYTKYMYEGVFNLFFPHLKKSKLIPT